MDTTTEFTMLEKPIYKLWSVLVTCHFLAFFNIYPSNIYFASTYFAECFSVVGKTKTKGGHKSDIWYQMLPILMKIVIEPLIAW